MKRGIIYKIENNINNKIYIGQTVNEKRRINEHRKGKNAEYMLIDAAILKYGYKQFSYDIVFEKIVDDKDYEQLKKELNLKEIEYIEKFNSRVPYGYNILKGGHSVCGKDNPMYGKHFTQDQLNKLSNSHKGIQNPMKGKHYTKRQKEIMAEKWRNTIQKKHNNGYIFQRKNIIVFKNGQNKGTYPNAKEIERAFGINYKRVHYALKRMRPLDSEWVFIYESKYNENILKEILKNETIKKQEHFKVKQLDNNNNVVAIFDSCEQASKIFGRHVWECCNGKRKTCKGYKFEYIIHTEQS